LISGSVRTKLHDNLLRMTGGITVPKPRRILLFDLFGVIAKDQRSGAMAQMAEHCGAPEKAFIDAYWGCRPAYDAARHTAAQYWATVLHRLSRPAHADTIEQLRVADIDSWSEMDDEMVDYVRSLRHRAEIGVLSNIPADHAAALIAAQPWLQALDLLALSGRIGSAKPSPAAFHNCVTALAATSADLLFIDDRDENTRAARDLGMHTHLFTGMRQLQAAIDDWLPEPASAPGP
jgi:putative hydrolase of the HAD superfamily